MPRRPNTRPTNIYWLYDTRPETVAVFGIDGQPFYCGKTVQSVKTRLREHRNNARNRPKGRVADMMLICAPHVRTQVMEIASPTEWADCERKWIATLRSINPDCTNISDGGDGAPGNICTPEQIEKRRLSSRGRVVAEETRQLLREANLGKRHSVETRVKMSASRTGRKQTEETKQKLREAHRGKVISEEQREQIRQTLTGRKLSPEHIANMTIANQYKAPETLAKMSENMLGRWQDPVEREKMMAGRSEGLRAAWVLRKAKSAVQQIPPPPY